MSLVDIDGLRVEPEDRPQQRRFTKRDIAGARIAFVHVMYAAGLSHRDIARFFRASPGAVQRWLKQEPNVSFSRFLAASPSITEHLAA